MYYYKIHERYLADLPAELSFMRHPNAFITRLTELDLSRGGAFKYLDVSLNKHMIYPIDEPLAPAVYRATDGERRPVTLTLNFTFTANLFYYLGVDFSSMEYITSSDIDTPIPSATTEHIESSVITSTETFVSYLQKEVKHRYDTSKTISSIPYGSPKKTYIIDTAIPAELVNEQFRIPHIDYRIRGAQEYSNPVTISRFFSSITGTPTVPFVDMVNMLGYSKSQLATLFNSVANLQHSITFVGVGGTGMNTLFWLDQIRRLIQFEGTLFHRLNIAEADEVEFSNLLRFPMDTSRIEEEYRYSKIRIAQRYADSLCRFNHIIKHRLLEDTSYGTGVHYNSDVFENESLISYKGYTNHYTYGAPDLVTRARLSDIGNFICATHADNSCSVWLNPTQDLDIQVESYGTIRLGTFFMNQLKLAITLLEIMNDTSIDLTLPNKHLLEYEFDSVNLPEAPSELRATYNFI